MRILVAILAIAAAGVQAQEFPEFSDARLTAGREVWMGTCRACHAEDVAGAPLVRDKAAWAPRLARGKDALYASALKGRVGPKGTEMPPRGGNDALKDDEVRAAVDYMTAIVAK